MEEKKGESDDGLCSVCIQICVKPARTPCGHRFCLECLEQVLEMHMQCPLCRGDIPRDFRPKVDDAYWATLQKRFGAELRAREEERKKREQDVMKIKFEYGNRHELVQSDEETQNKHRWTAFVKCARPDHQIGKYISSVMFELHPTFHDPRRTISAPPFELTCVGWGYFSIPIEITWNKKFGLPKTTVTHTLSFDGNGGSTAFFMEFNRKLLQ